MATSQKIKTRIASIENTRKITKAMELLSSAKLRRVKDNHNSIQEYYLTINDTFKSLVNKTKNIDQLIKLDQSKPKLYIVISSDLGLCGGYNINVTKELKKVIQKEDKVIILGTKGKSLLREYEDQVIQYHLGYGDDLNYDVVKKINNLTIKLMKEQEISGVNVIYTKFINSVSFEAKNHQILPVVKENFDDSKIKVSIATAEMEFEPSIEVVLKNLIPLYLSATIFNFMAESKISEMSSRRMAMESASDNAQEMIEYLQILFNRGRQASITQEISEIVGGSTAQ